MKLIAILALLIFASCTKYDMCVFEQGAAEWNNWCGKGSPTPVPAAEVKK